MRKFLISIIGALSIYSAFAAGENIPTSKSYVDAAIATKQDIISATTGASQVLTNTGTAGEYGTKEIYDSNATYGEQTDALIDAITMNTAVQNAIDSEFKCVEYDDHGECLLMDVFGTPPQSILPTGYTQLEYIESTGTQYIDTGIIVKATTLAEFEYQFVGSAKNYVFGQVAGRGMSIIGYRTDRIWWFRNTDLDLIDNNKHKVVFNQDGKVYRDGVVLATRGTFGTQQSQTILLFAELNDNNTINKGKVKIYNFKLKEGSTPSVIQNLVPARRNSDGVLGMYDTVTNAFFINKGTGEFVAGPIVYIPQSN